MEKKKLAIITSTGLLAVVAVAGVAAPSADAFSEQRGQRGGKEVSAEQRQERFEAFKATLSTDQQEILDEAKALHEEGNHEEAKELLENNGIERPGKGKHGGNRPEKRHRGNGEAKEAIASDDFEGFKAALGDSPFAEHITEDMFETMVEIHELRESGDKEAAKELMQELRTERQEIRNSNNS